MSSLKRVSGVTAWLPLALAIAAVFVVVWQLARPIQAGRADSRCPARLEGLADTVRISGGRAVGALPALTAIDGEGKPLPGNALLRFRFGADRDVLIRRQTFRLPPGAGALELDATLVNDFADLQRDRVLPSEGDQVMFRFVREPGPGTLTIVVCVDPDGPGALRPGDYVGAAAITTQSAQAATLGLDITAQDNRWWLVLTFALGGGFAGILVKLLADRRTLGAGAAVDFHPRRWAARTWFAFAAGVATAIYSYLTIYADDPTFTAELGTLWRVAAETFAGTLAAKTLTDLAPRKDE